MTEKVLFVDRSSLAGSVIRILARNIRLMSHDTIEVTVLTLGQLETHRFTDEKMIFVDPMISLNHRVIRRIPKKIKTLNFTISSYISLNAEIILEQIKAKKCI